MITFGNFYGFCLFPANMLRNVYVEQRSVEDSLVNQRNRGPRHQNAEVEYPRGERATMKMCR